MKKILMVVTILVSVLLVTACGEKKKESITAEEFYNRINSTYELVDVTSKIGYVKKAYAFEKDHIYFYFYEGNRSFDIGNVYKDEVQNVAGQMMDKKDTIDKGDNYSSITIQNDEEYYRIEYIDNTLLYAKTTANYKGYVDELFEKAGY